MFDTKEINYQFRQRYSMVHLPNRRDTSRVCGEGQVEVTDAWSIAIPADADAVLKNAGRDLEDYFFTSMNVCVKLVKDDRQAGDFCIHYILDDTLPANTYKVIATDTSIQLIGRDSRILAQAGYYLEDVMNLCEAPFLDKGEQQRTSLFNPRMTHSGYGIDMYPTEHLVSLAHLGMTAILLFVKEIDLTAHGYQDFNDLCLRAAQVGIDVYAYSYHENRMAPEDEGAEEYYENMYGTLFDRCPYLKGLIFVGESCEFPSRDPHTCGIRHEDDIDENGHLRRPLTEHPGWFPCYDYVHFMNLIRKIVYKRRPDADLVLWSYNWGQVEGHHRKKLLDALPKDISVLATYEMHETIVRDGVENYTTDYTLFTVGPGRYFTTEGQYAKENDLRFYSMTCTCGLTWDISVVPYLPSPYQWIKRFEGMREAHEKYGLVGTMESHHFGCAPSFVAELAKWAFYSPMIDLNDMVRRLAARDFSEECADTVCEAYQLFSDGIHHLISTDYDQYGPHRVGPSYPYQLYENLGEPLPSLPYAHYGSQICYTNYGYDLWGGEIGIGLDVEHPDEKKVRKFDFEIESFRKTRDYYAKGCELLASVISKVPENKRDNAERILATACFIRNTMRTSVGFKEFYKRKCRLPYTHGEEHNRLIDEMLELCRAEADNARDTIPLVEFDSRLGYEPSMEYMCDKEHLEWKLERLQRVIDHELPSHYEK